MIQCYIFMTVSRGTYRMTLIRHIRF